LDQTLGVHETLDMHEILMFKNICLGLAERIRFCQIQAKLRLLKYKIVLYKNFKKRTLSFRSRFIIRN